MPSQSEGAPAAMPASQIAPIALNPATRPFSREPVPRPARKTDRTRLRLVAAVREEFQANGGFTADRVARRAGSSPATFYNHFASKDDALHAAFSSAMDDLVAFVESQLRIERVLEIGLERFAADWILACVGFFRENSRVFSSAQMQIPLSKVLRGEYLVHEAAAFETFERFVRLGQAARVFREGDVAAIAHVMLIASEGYNNPAVLRLCEGDALHVELARSVVRMLRLERDESVTEQREGAR